MRCHVQMLIYVKICDNNYLCQMVDQLQTKWRHPFFITTLICLSLKHMVLGWNGSSKFLFVILYSLNLILMFLRDKRDRGREDEGNLRVTTKGLKNMRSQSNHATFKILSIHIFISIHKSCTQFHKTCLCVKLWLEFSTYIRDHHRYLLRKKKENLSWYNT